MKTLNKIIHSYITFILNILEPILTHTSQPHTLYVILLKVFFIPYLSYFYYQKSQLRLS